MQGLITTREVLRHPVVIVRAWGPASYLRCLRAIVSRRRITFLSAAVPPLAPA